MNIAFSSGVNRYLQNIKKKNPKLFNKVHKQLSLCKENPRHPSLRAHKLAGRLSNSWSISIESNIRMLYYVSDTEIVFFSIGTHDQVYRK